MERQARQDARRARRASLLPVALSNPALLYWGVVYADSAVSLMRGMHGEHLVKVTKGARIWARSAHRN